MKAITQYTSAPTSLVHVCEYICAPTGSHTPIPLHTHTQIEHILGLRYREELNPSLTISVYDVDRNETARIHRQELQMKLAEEERIRKEKEMDYLAPFLARIGDPPTLTNDEKKEVEKVG